MTSWGCCTGEDRVLGVTLCRYCFAPIALTGPAGWGSMDDFYPDLHCLRGPQGRHAVLLQRDVVRDLVRVYKA